MTTRCKSIFWLLCAAPALTGCSDGGTDDQHGYRCVRDPVLLAETVACSRDDQCPCGAHCRLGLCHHECMDDEDCDGWCDAFGHCRDKDDRVAVGRLSVPAEGILQVYPGHVRLHQWSEYGTFLLRAETKDLGEVRIAAEEGLLVRCAGEFVRECTLPGLAQGEEIRVALKPDGEDSELTEWGLNVYAGRQVRRVSVERAVPEEAAVEPGVYRGQVWIEEVRADLLGDQPYAPQTWRAGVRGFKVELEVRVYPGGRIALQDPFYLLSEQPGQAGDPPLPWVFQVHEDGSFDARDGFDDLSRRVMLGGAPSDADTTATEVAFAATGSLRVSGDQLMGTLDTALDGLGLTFAPPLGLDERPRIRWRFHVDRKEDLGAGEPVPELGGTRTPAFGPLVDRYPHELPWEAEVAGCGPLQPESEDPAVLVQQYLCYEHPGTGMDSATFSTDTGSLTELRDLRCDRADYHVWALQLFTNADRPTGGIQSDTMLTNCLADLACVHGAPPVVAETGWEGLDKLSSCDGANPGFGACIDGPLVLRALGMGMGAVERSGAPDMIRWSTTSLQAARLAHRTLQQWIQTHTFVAREARQANDALLGGAQANLEQALDASLGSWEVLLHPRVAARLLHMPAEVLREPDYRGDEALAAEMSEDLTQPVGVPVTILEGLRSQFEATSKLILRSRFENRLTPPGQLGSVLRHAAVLSALAQLLHEKAILAGEPPPWEDQWLSAKESFDRALLEMLTQYRQQANGENPLGIADVDLPLYRDTNPDWAGQKFSAVSSYLIDRWAQDAIDDAIAAKEDAVAAWENLRERQLQYEFQAGEQADRLAEIKRTYGEKILELCGNPHDLETAEDVLNPDRWPDLSADDCFVDRTNADCRYDEAELMQQLTVDDVNYQLCLAALLKVRMGQRAALDNGFLNQQLNKLLEGLGETFDPGSLDFWSALDPGIVSLGVQFFDCLDDQCMLSDAMDFRDLEITGDEDLEVVMQAKADCAARFPGGVPIAKRIEYLESSPMDKPDCYQGSIGELALTARAAAKDVEVARSELQDFNEAYQVAMNRCVIEETALKTMAAVHSRLNNLQKWMDKQQGQINWLCDLGTAMVDTFNVSGIGGKSGPSLGFDPGPLGKWFFGTYKDVAAEFMGTEEVRKLHDSFMAEFQHQMERALCFNEAEMQLVGVETQSRRIERSMLDLSHAILQMRNAQKDLARLITEGRRRVRAGTVRDRTSLFNDYWEDLWKMGEDQYRGAIERYRRKMRLAQRTLYLAVRAVEYEWQKSHLRRAEVLAATDPSSLETILDGLKEEIGTVSIGGAIPSDLHYVLSLKQQLLQLIDRQEWPDGLHRLSDTQRLRMLLASERYASFNSDGEYEGQLIPFSVMPLGVLGLGEPGTISLLTGEDCAERTWLVNAVIQGKDLVDDSSSFVRLQLRHRNTFFSQWCLQPTEEMGLMQSASVRPSRNLFQDPVYGKPGEYVGASTHDQSDFTKARIQAYLGISRDEFSEEAYVQGSSDELACRALYGEYALFFPASYLAVDGGQGLHLDRIDDILLRFDYVSVAKGW